ncbi:MAG: hypothetical protein JWN69_1310 [Alphaproteobacteria bacterium]|nr:hypothetical protein [Alphaproteobacteria bacterium]
MDNVRAFGEEADIGLSPEDEPVMEAPPEIGFDERRMHVRAYNYWVSLLGGRAYPSIEDLEPQNIDDFGPNSVLLDFTAGADNPVIAYLGRALRRQCELPDGIRTISDVPSRSLLSRLTDHYLQIIANCAPIGFEAEFVNASGINVMYRGILMPFSSDGDTIDFIYGVINWKELADSSTAAQLGQMVEQAIARTPAVDASPVWADGPNALPIEQGAPIQTPVFLPPDTSLELGVRYDESDDRAEDHDRDQPDLLALVLDPDAGLGDRLTLARECADAVKNAEGRSRAALYRALGEAYDFALAARDDPEDYAELLEDAGLKAQDRAPMTAVVKLVFGAHYDKSRLTEFAAALSYGLRQELALGGMAEFLERFDGGLKAVVHAERQARRTRPVADPAENAKALLRDANPLGYVELSRANLGAGDDDGEFVLLVARREADGRLAVVAPVAADGALLDRAIRKSLPTV